MEFNQELEQLELSGWSYGSDIPCPGNDEHQSEIWVTEEGGETEVCHTCQSIHHKAG